MKRGTPDHWKIDELASEIAALWPMPAELAVNTACGLMERLWHITGRYAPRGDLGRISDTLIARKVGWPGEASVLIAILVRIRWLDASAEFRLLVHDWPHHADDTVKKALENAEMETFADGSPVRREKPGKKKPPPMEPEFDLDSRTTRESLASASPPSEPSLSEPSHANEDMSSRGDGKPEVGFSIAERGRLRARLDDHPWAISEFSTLERDFFRQRAERGFDDDPVDGFMRWLPAVENHRRSDNPTKLERTAASEIRKQVNAAAADPRVSTLIQGIENRVGCGGSKSLDAWVDRKAASG